MDKTSVPNMEVLPPLTSLETVTPTKVAVTGATGYLAGPLVARLLAAGHTVHGTCRTPEKPETTAHLTALPGAAERLKLFKADLLTLGAFDEAFEGVEVVIHTASPFIIHVKKHEVEDKLLKPAVLGTQNVMSSVQKSPSILRVVLTSSCAAIYTDPHEFGKDHVYTEKDWNPTASSTVMPYSYSKMLAEKKAWEVAEKQSRWKLVVVNPGGVFGPPLSKRVDSESVDLVRKIATNQLASACPMLGIGYSDVRDIAFAHALAAFHPNANGRYIATSTSEWLADIVTRISKQFPGKIKPPGFAPPKWLLWTFGPLLGLPRDAVTYNIGKMPIFDNSKIKSELGMTFLPHDNTFKDQINAMVELGILKPL